MKPNTQAVREAQAWDRILAAVKAQAKASGADPSSLDVSHRDPGLQQLFRMEALADFLEAKPAEQQAKKQGTPEAEAKPEQPAQPPAPPAEAKPATVETKPAKPAAVQPATGKGEGGTL